MADTAFLLSISEFLAGSPEANELLALGVEYLPLLPLIVIVPVFLCAFSCEKARLHHRKSQTLKTVLNIYYIIEGFFYSSINNFYHL